MVAPFRLPPSQIALSSQGGTRQAHHEAWVDRPLDDLDLDELFQNVQPNLSVGDKVEFCAYLDKTWKQVMEVGACRVVWQGKDDDGVYRTRAVWIGEAFRVPVSAQGPAPKVPEQKLDIKKEFGGGFTVQDDKGHVIERFKTKKEAEDYVAHITAKPEQKAA